MADQPNQSKPTTDQTPKNGGKSAAASTQAYLNISEIKDGVIVLKDGSLRQVLMTSSLNFALKSNAEQDGIIYAYQRFLNSLSFPVQILVQSRRLDLDYYLEKLSKRADAQQIELVKLQILEYTEFIKRLISVTNIMDKRFFVVVPFYPTGTEQARSGFGKLFATSGSKQQAAKQAEQDFEKNKVQLRQRVESVASGLGGLGLRAVALNSEELVELFYSIYNPGTSTKERLLNVDELTAASIEKDGVAPDVLANVEAARMATGVSDGVVPAPAAPQTPASAEEPATPETSPSSAGPTGDVNPPLPPDQTDYSQPGGSNG